ncbi:MAG: hypothetical protein ACLP5V_03800 [Candidatus Bathyarchaeia archaeon]
MRIKTWTFQSWKPQVEEGIDEVECLMTKSMKFLGLVLLIVGASGVYHDFNRLRHLSLTIPYLWFVFAFLFLGNLIVGFIGLKALGSSD